MSKEHPLAHILRAIADGVPVEFRHYNSDWVTYDPKEHLLVINPIPDAMQWRIKPKSKVKKWRWIFQDYGDLKVSLGFYTEEEIQIFKPVQKIDSTEIEVDE